MVELEFEATWASREPPPRASPGGPPVTHGHAHAQISPPTARSRGSAPSRTRLAGQPLGGSGAAPRLPRAGLDPGALRGGAEPGAPSLPGHPALPTHTCPPPLASHPFPCPPSRPAARTPTLRSTLLAVWGGGTWARAAAAPPARGFSQEFPGPAPG